MSTARPGEPIQRVCKHPSIEFSKTGRRLFILNARYPTRQNQFSPTSSSRTRICGFDVILVQLKRIQHLFIRAHARGGNRDEPGDAEDIARRRSRGQDAFDIDRSRQCVHNISKRVPGQQSTNDKETREENNCVTNTESFCPHYIKLGSAMGPNE